MSHRHLNFIPHSLCNTYIFTQDLYPRWSKQGNDPWNGKHNALGVVSSTVCVCGGVRGRHIVRRELQMHNECLFWRVNVCACRLGVRASRILMFVFVFSFSIHHDSSGGVVQLLPGPKTTQLCWEGQRRAHVCLCMCSFFKRVPPTILLWSKQGVTDKKARILFCGFVFAFPYIQVSVRICASVLMCV